MKYINGQIADFIIKDIFEVLFTTCYLEPFFWIVMNEYVGF